MFLKRTATTLALLLMLSVIGSLRVAAQSDYNPANPLEPYALYRIAAAVEPAGAGYASGGGTYQYGQAITLRTSGNAGFVFQGWKKNGEIVSSSSYYSFNVGDTNDTLTAVYEYLPTDPSEPEGVYQRHLYLTTDMEGSCSFNRTNGAKADCDAYVTVTAYGSPGFVFGGWWKGGTKVSDTESFNYLMPDEDVTLEARYTYNPSSPDEPSSTQENVENTLLGDINADGTVDATDVVLLVNAYVAGTTDKLDSNVADLNQDGVIDASDVVKLVNLYLGIK